MVKLCFASNNKHKLEEIKHAVGGSFEIVGLSEINCVEELQETQSTLEGNALQKADFVYKNFKTPCFADDTGLEVEALDDAPGVFSARYAGEQKNSDDNIALLLKNMERISNRKARFRTIICLAGLTAEPVFFEGIINGTLLIEKRGENGFGYDPIFVPDGYTETFAEMSLAQKNALSHRAIAVQKLIDFLRSLRA